MEFIDSSSENKNGQKIMNIDLLIRQAGIELVNRSNGRATSKVVTESQLKEFAIMVVKSLDSRPEKIKIMTDNEKMLRERVLVLAQALQDKSNDDWLTVKKLKEAIYLLGTWIS